MTNIQIPKGFEEKQEELKQGKIKEAEEKLNKFLEDEGIVLLPYLNPQRDRLVCSFAVYLKEFLKPQEGEKSESPIVSS